jgi:hypothetical protein
MLNPIAAIASAKEIASGTANHHVAAAKIKSA